MPGAVLRGQWWTDLCGFISMSWLTGLFLLSLLPTPTALSLALAPHDL